MCKFGVTNSEKKNLWLQKSCQGDLILFLFLLEKCVTIYRSANKSEFGIFDQRSAVQLHVTEFFFSFVISKLRIVSSSITIDLLTTIADLVGTHRFTNCRSLRLSCSVTLPFNFPWKAIKLLILNKKYIY